MILALQHANVDHSLFIVFAAWIREPKQQQPRFVIITPNGTAVLYSSWESTRVRANYRCGRTYPLMMIIVIRSWHLTFFLGRYSSSTRGTITPKLSFQLTFWMLSSLGIVYVGNEFLIRSTRDKTTCRWSSPSPCLSKTSSIASHAAVNFMVRSLWLTCCWLVSYSWRVEGPK